jgi:hypothetical protein
VTTIVISMIFIVGLAVGTVGLVFVGDANALPGWHTRWLGPLSISTATRSRLPG